MEQGRIQDFFLTGGGRLQKKNQQTHKNVFIFLFVTFLRVRHTAFICMILSFRFYKTMLIVLFNMSYTLV